MYVIETDVDAAIVHYDAVTIVINVVVLDPAVASLNAEDALRSRPIYQIVEYHCVR